VSSILNPTTSDHKANTLPQTHSKRTTNFRPYRKADKGANTVILDSIQKIDEGLQQLSDDKFFKPLSSPIVLDTARKVKQVEQLTSFKHIDKMTYKWLNEGKNNHTYQNCTR